MGPLQGRRRRRHSVPHDSRRPACRPTSRAAPATTTKAQYSERPDDYVNNIDRLARKFETARAATCRSPMVDDAAGAAIGIIGYGTSHWAIDESRDQLGARAGIATGYLRLRALSVHRRA